MLALTILCISYFFSCVHASPLMMRDVFSPHITSPNETTEWPVGTQQTVTWETDNIPPDSQLTDPNGQVVLGHLGPTGGLNLDLDHPLAQDFKLRDGHVQITVPSVPPRDDYIIVLFGDSGNTSPTFAITRITSGSNSTTSTTKPSSTTTLVTAQHSSSATSSTSISVTEPTPSTGISTTGGQSAANTPTTTLLVPSTMLTASPISTRPIPASSLSALSSLLASSSPASSSVSSAADSLATITNSAWASHSLSTMQTQLGSVGFVCLLALLV